MQVFHLMQRRGRSLSVQHLLAVSLQASRVRNYISAARKPHGRRTRASKHAGLRLLQQEYPTEVSTRQYIRRQVLTPRLDADHTSTRNQYHRVLRCRTTGRQRTIGSPFSGITRITTRLLQYSRLPVLPVRRHIPIPCRQPSPVSRIS